MTDHNKSLIEAIEAEPRHGGGWDAGLERAVEIIRQHNVPPIQALIETINKLPCWTIAHGQEHYAYIKRQDVLDLIAAMNMGDASARKDEEPKQEPEGNGLESANLLSPATPQQRGISDVDDKKLLQLLDDAMIDAIGIIEKARPGETFSGLWWSSVFAHAFLKIPKKGFSPVSLESMKTIFTAAGRSCFMPDGSWQSEIDIKDGIKAILDAVRCPYVE